MRLEKRRVARNSVLAAVAITTPQDNCGGEYPVFGHSVGSGPLRTGSAGRHDHHAVGAGGGQTRRCRSSVWPWQVREFFPPFWKRPCCCLPACGSFTGLRYVRLFISPGAGSRGYRICLSGHAISTYGRRLVAVARSRRASRRSTIRRRWRPTPCIFSTDIWSSAVVIAGLGLIAAAGRFRGLPWLRDSRSACRAVRCRGGSCM